MILPAKKLEMLPVHHIPADAISEEAVEMLREMFRYLQRDELDAKLNMLHFSDAISVEDEDCGTAGCLVGHTPFLKGQLPRAKKALLEGWGDYADRVYDADLVVLIEHGPNSYPRGAIPVWTWFFHGAWGGWLNFTDHELALLRLGYFFEYNAIPACDINEAVYFVMEQLEG